MQTTKPIHYQTPKEGVCLCTPWRKPQPQQLSIELDQVTCKRCVFMLSTSRAGWGKEIMKAMEAQN